MPPLDDLERRGALRWRAEEHAWVADPEEVVQALTKEGFQEYKRELAKAGRDRATCGGMWQALDPRTGAVATVIWTTHVALQETHVFIEIDGRPVEGSAWAEIDDAVLDVLAAGGGRLTPGQIAERVGMSEGAVQSVVSMLVQQGKLRIAVVELPNAALTGDAPVRRPLAVADPPARPGGERAAS